MCMFGGWVKCLSFEGMLFEVQKYISKKLSQNRLYTTTSVFIQNYSGPYFLAFVLNTERCYVSCRIQSKCGKIRTRITPNTETFYGVTDTNSLI